MKKSSLSSVKRDLGYESKIGPISLLDLCQNRPFLLYRAPQWKVAIFIRYHTHSHRSKVEIRLSDKKKLLGAYLSKKYIVHPPKKRCITKPKNVSSVIKMHFLGTIVYQDSSVYLKHFRGVLFQKFATLSFLT